MKGFVFNNRIIPPLFIVLVTGYRKELIVEVLEIIRGIAPRREGFWDSVMIAKIAEGMIANKDEKGC